MDILVRNWILSLILFALCSPCLAQTRIGATKDASGSLLEISRTRGQVFFSLKTTREEYSDVVITRQQARLVQEWLSKGRVNQSLNESKDVTYGFTNESKSGRIGIRSGEQHRLVICLESGIGQPSGNFVVDNQNYRQTLNLLKLAGSNDYKGNGLPDKYIPHNVTKTFPKK